MVVFFYFLYCYTSDLALAYDDDDNKDCYIKKNQASSPLPRASFTSHLMLMQYSDSRGTILDPSRRLSPVVATARQAGKSQSYIIISI